MNITNLNSGTFDINLEAQPSKLEIINHNKPVVTFDSLDISEDQLQIQFEKAVQKIPQSKEEIQLQRVQKKMEMAAKKQAAAEKTKIVYNVTIPENKTVKGEELLKLRFSQDSIQGTTSDNKLTLDQLAGNMLEKGWLQGTSLVLVKMPDESLVSMNNRRLFAAKKAAELEINFEVPVTIYKHSDVAPKNLLKGIVAEFKKGQKNVDVNRIANQIIHNTYGHAVTLRINTRNGDLANSVLGYEQTPLVRAK